MEKQSKTTKKLKSFMWFIISSIPLLFLVGYLFVNVFGGGDLSSSSDFTSNLFAIFGDVNTSFNFATNNLMYTSINKFINLIFSSDFEISSNAVISYISICLSWYVMTELLHIIVDFILILPNMVKLLLRKGGFDNE